MGQHIHYSISQEICTRFLPLLCFVVVIHWLIFPYPSGLLHWHCGNLTIAPVPKKQPWWIWINTSCELIMKDCITTTKQSTTKPCAYFLGYTVYIYIYIYVFTKANFQKSTCLEIYGFANSNAALYCSLCEQNTICRFHCMYHHALRYVHLSLIIIIKPPPWRFNHPVFVSHPSNFKLESNFWKTHIKHNVLVPHCENSHHSNPNLADAPMIIVLQNHMLIVSK